MRSSCWTSPQASPLSREREYESPSSRRWRRDFGFRPFLVHRLDKETVRLPRRRPYRRRGREVVPPDRVAGAAQDLSRSRLGRSGRGVRPLRRARRRPRRRQGRLHRVAAPRVIRRPCLGHGGALSLLPPRARARDGAHASIASTWPLTACPSSATTATETSPSTSVYARRRASAGSCSSPGRCGCRAGVSFALRCRSILRHSWGCSPTPRGPPMRSFRSPHESRSLRPLHGASWLTPGRQDSADPRLPRGMAARARGSRRRARKRLRAHLEQTLDIGGPLRGGLSRADGAGQAVPRTSGAPFSNCCRATRRSGPRPSSWRWTKRATRCSSPPTSSTGKLSGRSSARRSEAVAVRPLPLSRAAPGLFRHILVKIYLLRVADIRHGFIVRSIERPSYQETILLSDQSLKYSLLQNYSML